MDELDYKALEQIPIPEGLEERLEWVPFDTDKTVYPTFFKTELANPVNGVRYIVMDERD